MITGSKEKGQDTNKQTGEADKERERLTWWF